MEAEDEASVGGEAGVTRDDLMDERENLRIRISLAEENGQDAAELREELLAAARKLAAASVAATPPKKRRTT